MIGLVVVAHGGLAAELLAATEHVVGDQKNAVAISIAPSDDIHAKQKEITDAVTRVDTGAGVAVVTDMFGGTPANLAMGALATSNVEVVYGANLPLLVKLATRRGGPLKDAVALALNAGRKYLVSSSHILNGDD